MTQRTILAGKNQTIIIKVGGSVTVRGHDSDQVIAESKDIGGLILEQRSESEIGRARAAIGDHMLFDWKIKVPSLGEKKAENEVVEVQMSTGGQVRVPFESNLKVYAGKGIDVQAVQGQVDAYSGLNLSMQDVYCLGNVSAGGAMNIDCQTMIGKDVTFSAGSDLRFHVADLTSARLRVKDLGGYWEARVGEGEKSVYLKSGGDVTFVTDQKIEALPPNYVLGKIEKTDKQSI
jgi:hypothetical protein